MKGGSREQQNGKVMVDEMQAAIEDKEKSKEAAEDNKIARRWWLILCKRMSVQCRDGLEQQCFKFHPCLLFNSSVQLDHILTFPSRGIIEWLDRWITVLNCEGLNITPSGAPIWPTVLYTRASG